MTPPRAFAFRVRADLTLRSRRERGASRRVSGRAPVVSVMQAADLWDRDHAPVGRLDGTRLWWILVEGKVRPGVVVVVEIAGEHAAQVAFAEDDDVIETFTADAADEALHAGILPRALRRADHLFYAHVANAIPEGVTKDAVAITHQKSGRRVLRKGLDELLCSPDGGGAGVDPEMEDAAAVEGEHDEDVQDLEHCGGDRE